jgi:hypothetical protein
MVGRGLGCWDRCLSLRANRGITRTAFHCFSFFAALGRMLFMGAMFSGLFWLMFGETSVRLGQTVI